MAKRAFDIVVAGLALLLLAPLLVALGLWVRLDSPGPALFRQERVGRFGRTFRIHKFRTMVDGAPGPQITVGADARITRAGAWLRAKKLDELPQLIDVLAGDMSLVGPRPLPVDEIKRIHDMAHRRRLSVKPGLTCLWQVSGRNEIKDFDNWVRLDLEYIDNWSLWLDFKILLRTIPAVFGGSGAK